MQFLSIKWWSIYIIYIYVCMYTYNPNLVVTLPEDNKQTYFDPKFYYNFCLYFRRLVDFTWKDWLNVLKSPSTLRVLSSFFQVLILVVLTFNGETVEMQFEMLHVFPRDCFAGNHSCMALCCDLSSRDVHKLFRSLCAQPLWQENVLGPGSI